jgi:thymidylate synthase
MYKEQTIIENSIDDLIVAGIRHIETTGEPISVEAGDAIQSYNVTYVLNNTLARIHTLRNPVSKKYLAGELMAYFRGSLQVDDLAQASKFWQKLADKNGMINSNYGYYVFRALTPTGISQLDFVRDKFRKNLKTRKALININGIQHKTTTKDFPCTLGLQFHIEDDRMNCDVTSRSTDILTGLPYDMAFFSFVNELVAGLVSADTGQKLCLGYTAMHATFTQIYSRTRRLIDKIEQHELNKEEQEMPKIIDAIATLTDILEINHRKPTTDVIKWIERNAK